MVNFTSSEFLNFFSQMEQVLSWLKSFFLGIYNFLISKPLIFVVVFFPFFCMAVFYVLTNFIDFLESNSEVTYYKYLSPNSPSLSNFVLTRHLDLKKQKIKDVENDERQKQFEERKKQFLEDKKNNIQELYDFSENLANQKFAENPTLNFVTAGGNSFARDMKIDKKDLAVSHFSEMQELSQQYFNDNPNLKFVTLGGISFARPKKEKKLTGEPTYNINEIKDNIYAETLAFGGGLADEGGD